MVVRIGTGRSADDRSWRFISKAGRGVTSLTATAKAFGACLSPTSRKSGRENSGSTGSGRRRQSLKSHYGLAQAVLSHRPMVGNYMPSQNVPGFSTEAVVTKFKANMLMKSCSRKPT